MPEYFPKEGVKRGHSFLEIKSVDAEQRIIEGIASTPELDRQGDSMDPAGAKFALPMPLLWQHNAKEPIGNVISAKVTTEGILIKAQIEREDEPGKLKDLLDFAWGAIRRKLVRGLSIDWNPLAPPTLKSGAARYSQWEWLALSAVTIPANQSASIRLIKSLDREQSAASGTTGRIPSIPGVSGSSKASSMNVSETLTEEREALQTKSARLEELMAAEGTDGGLEADEQAELETLTKEMPVITAKINRLSTLEAAQAAQAKSIGYTMPAAGVRQRSGIQIKSVELPKGTLFTRVAMAVAAGKGSRADTLDYAKQFSNTPEVLRYIKDGYHQKATAGGPIVESPGWGGELVNPNTILTEYVELLRAETIIGRVQGFRKAAFNVPIITQTGGSTFAWVGPGAPKPVGELEFEESTLGYAKVAGIIVLKDELVRLSTPNAEEIVRQSMVEDGARFLDQQFIQVGIAAGASNPASITNGVASPAATGTTAAALRHDLNIALQVFTDAGVATRGLVIVMTSALARGISLLTTSLGVAEFPGMTPEGGTLLGYQVIVSDSVDSGTIVVFQPREIFLADDGRITLDASREATLDMSGGSTATFNLWQNNCVGIRAEQWIRWQKRRAAGVVAVIDTAAYAPA